MQSHSNYEFWQIHFAHVYVHCNILFTQKQVVNELKVIFTQLP